MDYLNTTQPLIREVQAFSWKKCARVCFTTFLLIGGVFCLFSAIWGGLVRIGWDFSSIRPGLPAMHGPLVVCGFLGTFFSFERAISLKRGWAFLSPFLISLGALSLLIKPAWVPSTQLVTAGSIGFIFICFVSFRRQPNLFTGMIFLGSLLWLGGILIWLARWPVFNVYLWWMGFVLFGLIGERLELAQRIRLGSPPFPLLILTMGTVFAGQILMVIGHLITPDNMDIYMDAIVDPRLKIGMRVAGVGMILTALWLLKYDAAWSTMSNGGMAGYTAGCFISGYLWLGITGVFSFIFAGLVSGVRYDALLHSFFVGFVGFVLFGHGPIIFVSSCGLRFKNVSLLSFEVILLHISLLIRIAGDIFRFSPAKKMGGLLNALALVSFFIILTYWFLSDRLTKIKEGQKHVQKNTDRR